MKINDKVFNPIVGLVFFFIVNLAVSSFCMSFLDLDFRHCLLYSVFNAIWMPILIPSLMGKIKF
jgi:hypothetical protein